MIEDSATPGNVRRINRFADAESRAQSLGRKPKGQFRLPINSQCPFPKVPVAGVVHAQLEASGNA
jgi:hypothetical protein